MHYPIRSCVSCKTRRVRCDRQQPSCGNCSRARGLDQDCVYPTGRGRAPKRRRNGQGTAVGEQPPIAERLARLETMIRHAGRQDQGEAAPDTALGHRDSAPHLERSADAALDERLGRLKVTETKSHYLHDVMWESLADEVEELRDLLLGDEAESDEATATPSQNGSAEAMPAPNPSTVLFGLGAPAGSLLNARPSLVQAAALFAAFCENVAPVMRVMHLPTLTRQYWDAAASPDKMGRNTEALVSAINFAAAATMSDGQCLSELGQTHQDSLAHYRTAAEQALSRAHLLGTRSPAALQAAVLYAEALPKAKAAPSAVRALAVLVHHLARAMGLHRDAAAFGRPPFEAELRRRLWWYVCILDHRTAEACGDAPAARPRSGDARMPLHVDDAHLVPGMLALPAEREGFADMTFCLVRYEALRAVWRMDGEASLAGKQAAIGELERRLEDRYLRHCDPGIPFQLKVLLSARLMLKRLWFVAHWPSREKHDNLRPPQQGEVTKAHGGATRDQLFAAAADLLESAAGILAVPALAPWTWHAQTYSLWHAVAFALHELRRRPPSGPGCERAWRYVCVVCDGWLADSKATGLAGPIGGLWETVRRERENQGEDDSGKRGHIGAVLSGGNGGEADGQGDSLESVIDVFPPEPGDMGDFSYSLTADHDMGEYFHPEDHDLFLGTLGMDTTSSQPHALYFSP